MYREPHFCRYRSDVCSRRTDVLLVIITTSAFAAAICAVISSLQGKTELSEDPIFLERLKKGLVSMQSKEDKVKPATHEAKLSVLIFLSGVSVIVLLLLFKNQIGHTLSSRDLIVMIMMFCAWLMSFAKWISPRSKTPPSLKAEPKA